MFVRLYTGDDAQSHFEDLPIGPEGAEATSRGSSHTPCRPASGFRFAFAPPDYKWDWHNTPKRHCIVILSGEVELAVGDGSKRRIGPGDVLLAEDVTGRGHLTRVIGGKPFTTVNIALT